MVLSNKYDLRKEVGGKITKNSGTFVAGLMVTEFSLETEFLEIP